MEDPGRRVGGIAALAAAGAFVFGFALFATVLSDYVTGDPAPAESVAFVSANQGVLHLWYTVILIAFGVVLVPLVLAVHRRLRGKAPAATAFGLIWAGLVIAAGMIGNIGLATVADLSGDDPQQARAVWLALDATQNGLGGGNEVVGGLWVLMVGVAALRGAALPRGLAGLGVATGCAGIMTVVPGLEAVGAAFGIGLIVWFIWAGVVLLRRPAPGGSTDTIPMGTPLQAAGR